MKKLLFLTIIATVFCSAAQAQKLVIGERAPEMKVREWLSEKPADNNKARLIEFFHSSSKQSEAQLAALDQIARKYESTLTVIVITRESPEKVAAVLNPDSSAYYVAVDDGGRSFANFAVQFVPFSVLIDAKGRVKWFGNSTSLYEDTISKKIK